MDEGITNSPDFDSEPKEEEIIEEPTEDVILEEPTAEDLELVRHTGRDGGRVVALRLFLLHHLYRRRSQTPG